MNINKNAIFNLLQQPWPVHTIFLFIGITYTQKDRENQSHSARSSSGVSALYLNDHSTLMWSSISFYSRVRAEPRIWDLRTLLNLAHNTAAADPLSNNKLNSEEPQCSFILQAGPNFPNSACSFSLALVLSFHQAIISCATGLTAPASLLSTLLSCLKKRTQRKRF